MKNKIFNIENIHNNIFWIFAVSIAVIVFGGILGGIIFGDMTFNNPFLDTFIPYISFVGIWFTVLMTCLLFQKNRFILEKISSKSKGNTFLFLFYGLILGVFLNGICAIVAMINGDFKLEFIQFNFIQFIILLFAVFVQSSAEEVFCRGFLYQRLLKSTNSPTFAIFFNSLFFSALHLSNDGMTILSFYNIFIVGIFLSMIVYYFDSLWMAMAIHATWNFTQSIFLGLPNSGNVFPYSVFGIEGAVKNSFAYDQVFGVEGTILSTFILTLCCIVLYFVKKRKR